MYHKMRLLILLISLTLYVNIVLSNSANDDSVGTRIYKGLDAIDGEYPFIARISDYLDRVNAYCSGAIIHKNWIITAGHCLMDRPQKVTVGTRYANGYGGQVYWIKDSFNPETYVVWSDIDRYTGRLKAYYSDYDVGLILLKSSIDFSQYYVATVAIDTSYTNYERQATTYVGWGRTSKDSKFPTATLQFAQARVEYMSNCRKEEPTWVLRDNLHICTSPEFGSTICPGDSGGPLIQYGTNKLIGVANHGTCGEREPSVFHKVNVVQQWIRDTMKAQGDSLGY